MSVYLTRIPEITAKAALATQRAVEETGQEIEFLVEAAMAGRRETGREQARTRWVPSRTNPYKGEVKASAFYTRFSEYGTRYQAARPVLGPAAETAYPHFVNDVGRAFG